MSEQHIAVRLNNRIAELEARSDTLTALLTDAMKIIATYTNVPEAAELRARWEALKGQ